MNFLNKFGRVKVRRCFFASLIMAAALPLAAGSAFAHHSTAAFDATRLVTISGTVTESKWMNPHSYLYIKVPGEKGAPDQVWTIISGTPQLLLRNGWKRDSVKPGDKVSATINPQRAGGPEGILYNLQTADGRTFSGPRQFLAKPQ